MTRGGRASRETGSILIIAILLTTLISALGISLALATSAERLIAGAHRATEELLHACEAGLERALADLFLADDWGPALRGEALSTFQVPAPALSDEARLDLRLLTQSLQRESDRRFPTGPDRPVWQLYAYGPLHEMGEIGSAAPSAFLLVWVADDPDDGDGRPTADNNDRILVHAEARGPSGGRRTVELVLGRSTGGVPGTPIGARARVLHWRQPR